MNLRDYSLAAFVLSTLVISPSGLAKVSARLHFQTCGVYELTGHLECETEENCLLRIHPGAQSEQEIKLKNPNAAIGFLTGRQVKLKARVDQLDYRSTLQVTALDRVPHLNFQKDGRLGVKLIKKEKCTKS